MVGDSNYDRAYLMALFAWKTFGHTSEPHQMFARRMAVIGRDQGINAAAEAIAEDCRQHGLQMSAHRVLGCLASELGRHRDLLSRLGSIEEFELGEIGKLPPGLVDLLEGKRNARTPWGCLVLIIIALAAIGWLIFR